jgi:hypothetical protein
MNGYRTSTHIWLAAVVAMHLIVSIAHGSAHSRAQVLLSPAAMLFVFVVIIAGPLVGLAILWRAERFGAWIIAVTMAGSLLFGLVNHFVLSSPDHVAHVTAAWRPLFAATAVLLIFTEALGSSLAIRVAMNRENLT